MEQYMMYQKARCFGDSDAMEKIYRHPMLQSSSLR